MIIKEIWDVKNFDSNLSKALDNNKDLADAKKKWKKFFGGITDNMLESITVGASVVTVAAMGYKVVMNFLNDEEMYVKILDSMQVGFAISVRYYMKETDLVG